MRAPQQSSPLQLPVIARALELWSRPDDVVLTPFLGIGSEAHESLRLGRRAIGIELKSSYYRQAVQNCLEAANVRQGTLWDEPQTSPATPAALEPDADAP